MQAQIRDFILRRFFFINLSTYLPTYLPTYLSSLPTYLPTSYLSPEDVKSDEASDADKSNEQAD